MDSDQQNNLTNKIETEKTDSCRRGGVLGVWVKKGEGIKQTMYVTHRCRQQDGGRQREQGIEGGGCGQREDGRGWRET